MSIGQTSRVPAWLDLLQGLSGLLLVVFIWVHTILVSSVLISHDAMYAVFHGKHGSARAAARGASYLMAGKSGTAQVVGIAQDAEYDADELQERHRDHGLFIAFAPYEDPQIAVAVVVENGGGGSSVAAPIARAVMDAWMASGEVQGDG